MKPRHKKFALVIGGLALLGVATALVLNAFQSNLVFFFTPSQVANKEAPVERAFRVGGMVEEGSIRRDADGLTVRFVITDRVKSIPVAYKGILPDLFKEGKGAVVQGKLGQDGQFTADQVLAKHDENYMPPEAAQALADAKKTAEQTAKTLKQ
jgi:cytochrome c-type biogenesis protein CcmE